MKKFILMLLPCFLLVSCSRQEDRDTIKEMITKRFNDAASMQIEAIVSAEFSDRVADYRIAYQYTKDQNGIVTVLEPESIAGVKATVGKDGCKLQFADTILETGVTNDEKITPMNALAKLMYTWCMGDISEIGEEKHADINTWLIVYREGNIEYRTWFIKENLCPVYAEILNNDRVILRIQYEKCSM